ncbi:uncharacterized protein BDV14DRAFT_168971 [Aspergillus stella-maris]|uniref:uncharacterized protein n=1 Tax=Aspergillus stella-maris TaxID=1810926 RepID=UPI003CCDFF85
MIRSEQSRPAPLSTQPCKVQPWIPLSISKQPLTAHRHQQSRPFASLQAMPANHLVTHKDQEYAVFDLQVQTRLTFSRHTAYFDENDKDPMSEFQITSLFDLRSVHSAVRSAQVYTSPHTYTQGRKNQVQFEIQDRIAISKGTLFLLRTPETRLHGGGDRRVSCSCASLQVARFVWGLGLVTWMPWVTGEVRRAVCLIVTCTCIELFLRWILD